MPCHSCQLQKPLWIKTFPESCWGAHTDSLRCKFWGNWWKLCEITVASALSCQGDSWISEQISNLFSAASDAPGGSQLRATASASAESWDLATLLKASNRCKCDCYSGRCCNCCHGCHMLPPTQFQYRLCKGSEVRPWVEFDVISIQPIHVYLTCWKDGTFTQFNERHKEAWLCNEYNYRDTRRVPGLI